MGQFAVIGLGSFGATVARELAASKHEVIGIDSEKKYVEELAQELTHAVIADATDERVLRELNLEKCDAVIVAIGEDIEASILCVLHLTNIGVKKIWVKAKTKAHHMILSHLQVDKIIHPEEDMGVRVAQALNYPIVSRYMRLDHDHYIVKIIIDSKLHGVHALGVTQNTEQIKILLVQRNLTMFYEVQPTFHFEENDILILEGPLTELKKLLRRFE